MAKVKFQVTKQSPIDGKMNSMEFEAEREDYEAWKRGEKLIQTALPYLTPDEREFLLTGITPEQWNELFGGKGM
jgi:hypothetical protein